MPRHSPRRICFLNSTPFWGGGEEWSLQTATRLQDRGHEVSLIVQPGSPFAAKALEAGLDTTQVATTRRSGLNPLVHRRLKLHFTQRRVDTVVFNGPADIKAGGLSAVAAGVGCRAYQRGLAKPIRDHILNRFLFTRILTCVVAHSEATKSAILSSLTGAITEARIRVVPLGIDLDQFQAGPAERDPGPVVLANVGRLAPEKDQRALVDVAAELTERGHRVRLLIAGVGPLDVTLVDHARARGVDDVLELVGFIDDVPGFLATIDVFVLSSRSEGFGLVMVEAGAASRPVVAFNTTSTPEIIVEGVTGFLVPPGDIAAFADRVEQLIEDPALRRKMGQSGRRHVEAQFDVERSVSAFEDALWGPTE